jgi:hypothetical protein
LVRDQAEGGDEKEGDGDDAKIVFCWTGDWSSKGCKTTAHETSSMGKV